MRIVSMPRLLAASIVVLTTCMFVIPANAQSGSRGGGYGSRGGGSGSRSGINLERQRRAAQQQAAQQAAAQAARQAELQRRAERQSSLLKTAESNDARLGFEGYCPVCLLKMKKWIEGVPEYNVIYDGTIYFFPNERMKTAFLSNQAKYAPALGGDCTVCYADSGKRVPGNVRFASVKSGRIFMFPSEAELMKFKKSPRKYVNVDLAFDGKSVVRKTKDGKMINGKRAFTSVHNGIRYQFSSSKEQKVFDQSPEDYLAGSDRQDASTKKGSSTELGSIDQISASTRQGSLTTRTRGSSSTTDGSSTTSQGSSRR